MNIVIYTVGKIVKIYTLKTFQESEALRALKPEHS